LAIPLFLDLVVFLLTADVFLGSDRLISEAEQSLIFFTTWEPFAPGIRISYSPGSWGNTAPGFWST
jgi:hypothetical protein